MEVKGKIVLKFDYEARGNPEELRSIVEMITNLTALPSDVLLDRMEIANNLEMEILEGVANAKFRGSILVTSMNFTRHTPIISHVIT